MIKIKRGDSVLTVTAGAYSNYYKHLGYEPVGVAKSNENSEHENAHTTPGSPQPGDPTQQPGDEEAPDEDEESDLTDEEAEEEVDLSEIPLGEMDLSQLCAYADQLGLDHDGIRSRKEMRKLIREHLN